MSPPGVLSLHQDKEGAWEGEAGRTREPEAALRRARRVIYPQAIVLGEGGRLPGPGVATSWLCGFWHLLWTILEDRSFPSCAPGSKDGSALSLVQPFCPQQPRHITTPHPTPDLTGIGKPTEDRPGGLLGPSGPWAQPERPFHTPHTSIFL